MATTFNVISLGRTADLDTVEGNSRAEGASDLVGQSFGSETDPLSHHIQTLSQGSATHGSGNSEVYDLANPSIETFRVDDGPDQVFDGVASFWATITYVDGTTANISAVIFQDTSGNTYLAPEYSDNTDQARLEAKPIQSLSIDRVAVDSNVSGFVGDREAGNFMVCFAEGTQLGTPSGLTAIEQLSVGDAVFSVDNGPQTIRWIGAREVAAPASMRPVRIRAGALGNGLPLRDLHVSQQHRVLAGSGIVRRLFGQSEVLIAAKKLVGLPGITLAQDRPRVTYWHILSDRHEIVLAEGAPAETLFAGKEASVALGPKTVTDIKARCPDLAARFDGDVPARFLPSPKEQKEFAKRLLMTGKPVIANGLAKSLISSSKVAAMRSQGLVNTVGKPDPASFSRSMASKWCPPDSTTFSTCNASAGQGA
ncbi:Hint domain-containing protein [Sedimentitalea sp.]|uniref:Hint domain-containing protein n=1 Tax=Sedimentitalea sp. TaxID=2048915 RepID=UPI003298FCEF